MFIQEIQDNSGKRDDGTVCANLTLTNLVNEIANASGGIQYDFVQIDPVDKQDGVWENKAPSTLAPELNMFYQGDSLEETFARFICELLDAIFHTHH